MNEFIRDINLRWDEIKHFEARIREAKIEEIKKEEK